MNHSHLLVETLLFLLAAVVIVPVFHRLRTSPILGYLAAGMLIGPHVLGLVSNAEDVATLAEFGVVFLLFMIGLELSIERLLHMGRYVFGLGAAQVLATGCAIAAAAVALGFDVKAAVIIGGALALSSTAFVLKLLDERGERATRVGYMSFAILLLQDLAVVPLLILVTTLSRNDTSIAIALAQAFVEAAVALLIVIWGGRRLLRPLFHRVARTRSSELFLAVTLLAVLGTSYLLSLAGLSMALGAFLAGLLLAETEYRHQVEADIRPFRGLLLGLFFITIGMSIDLGLVISKAWLVAGLVAALLAGKTLITALLCRLFGTNSDVALRTGLALSQGGEFGFVLFGAAGAHGLIPTETVQILLAVISLSMVTTPALVWLGHRLSPRVFTRESAAASDMENELGALSDHVIIAGFGRVGRTVAKVIADSGTPYVALDLDRDRVASSRARNLPVYFGNGSQLGVLRAAGLDRAIAVVITFDQVVLVNRLVSQLRQRSPELMIFVRARDMNHLRKLKTDGATAIVPETAEASLQLGAIVLQSLGVAGEASSAIVDNYRQDTYARLDDGDAPSGK